MAIVGALPVTLTNGNVTDATQVQQNQNFIASQVNANAADTQVTNTFAQPQVVANAAARNNMITAGQVQDGVAQYLTGVAGIDTITATAAFDFQNYVTGQEFWFVASATNTGPVTINISGRGAMPVKKNGANALVAGDIIIGAAYSIFYDATSAFQISTFTATPTNYQAFTGNGNWAKPAGLSGNELVVVEAWGGGGGGSTNAFANRGGGGGGGYISMSFRVGAIASPIAVTVGALVAAGVIGNNSSFGALLTAFGGGAGGAGVAGDTGGGGGGGSRGAGGAAAGANGGVGGLGYALRVAPAAGADGGADAGAGGGSAAVGGSAFWGGGGGGGTTNEGGTSTFGGGGGAGHGAGVGGVSLFGGHGGASGANGTAPGGGGGGNGGGGARGEVRVWIVT